MRGVRIAALLLVIGLALPGALLVRRALESLAVEREVRHRAVAERAFDEMERMLSGLLAVEENRSFEQYGFYQEEPDPSRSLEAQRSPLSRKQGESFVFGHYQIDPDGSVHSPREPRSSQPRPPGWTPKPEALIAIAAVRELVDASWSAAPGKLEATQASSPAHAERRLEDAEAKQLAAEPTAYDLLQRLNVASEDRAARKRKTQYARSTRRDAPAEVELEEAESPGDSRAFVEGSLLAQGAYGDAKSEISAASFEAPQRSSPATAPPSLLAKTAGAGRLASEQDKDDQSRVDEATPKAPAVTPVLAEELAAEPTIRITLDPIASRPPIGSLLVLYRTVLVGEQGYRQGLVVDLALLGNWLEDRVIDARGLSDRVEVLFGGAASVDSPIARSGGYVFAHRFAEPFESLQIDLALTPLPGMGSATTIYLLALLLAAACSLGIFALYRMVAVAVQFAERRSNFVASVSHELKTPLTSIRMYAEMLRDGLVSSEDKRDEYYATISDESERLSRLVENVLEFSRLEKGSRDLAARVGPLGPLVHEVADTLRPHAEREGFRLTVVVDESLPPVRYDRDAVVQVLFNLVDNAIKYARDASRREIEIECRHAKGGVVIEVRDFGPGVAKQNLSRIFEPFYRGGEELTRTAKGTGIGLALVKELAQAMGARVSGTNLEGGGFCVRVAFSSAESA